ncbi:MAG: tetratricopeptide repeat protein, partial [Clostridia bacterium]|nr:tetratricopeptide repeat protein [Clostridia bacterium]
MASGKVLTIDFSEDRLRKKAEGYFEDGEYISALEYARKYLALYGKEKDMYALIADIYENMGLHSSAVNSWFQYLDCCEAEDLPEVYEGLAVNFLNLGNEAQSAFYYNRLIDEDDTLTVEDKREIAETFRPDSKSPLKFVHPPELTDYSEQLYSGGEALKSGRIEEAIKTLSKVEKGSKEYRSARETLAIAYLLNGNAEQAEKTCLEVIEEYGDSVQALSTLSAIYSEQGKKGESREIAYRLYQTSGNNKEEIYKIATVCCENDMHEEAFQLFSKLEKDLPYDGNF